MQGCRNLTVEAHATQLLPLPLTMFLKPLRYHVSEAVLAEVGTVDDAEPAVLKFLAGDHLERAAIRLPLLVDGDGSCLNARWLVQPELQDVAQPLLHFARGQKQHEEFSESLVAPARPRDPEHLRQVSGPELEKVLDEDAEGGHHLAN